MAFYHDQYKLAAVLLERSSPENELGITNRLAMNQQVTLVTKKGSGVLGCIKKQAERDAEQAG